MPQRSNSARYLWGDRNALDSSIVYAGLVAPHAGTVRATYTVPAGNKSAIQNIYAKVRIVTAAAPAGQRECNIIYVIGGINYYIALCSCNDDQNLPGQHETVGVGVGAVLLAGDAVSITTADNGTGGTVLYNGAVKITTYDA